jgi:hypothetical protein
MNKPAAFSRTTCGRRDEDGQGVTVGRRFLKVAMGCHQLTEGAVLDWDHETRTSRAIAQSLGELLARAVAAIKNKELFGGPEVSSAASARA